ncbi:MAG: hypothetical protein GY883_20580 [Shimia sp.]|nr:hypothetical protein [Shimia sp.]
MKAAATLLVVLQIVLASAGQTQTCEVISDAIRHERIANVYGQEASCAWSLNAQGGTSRACFWEFGFRSEGALRAYRDLRLELVACADGPVAHGKQSVNHPDSYVQTEGRVLGAEVSVALKDKASLGRTLVVLRYGVD